MAQSTAHDVSIGAGAGVGVRTRVLADLDVVGIAHVMREGTVLKIKALKGIGLKKDWLNDLILLVCVGIMLCGSAGLLGYIIGGIVWLVFFR